MKFPRAKTSPFVILMNIIRNESMTIEELMKIGQTTETRQRNRVQRNLGSLISAQCIYVVNGRYRPTPDAEAYAADLIEIDEKKKSLDVVGPPYVRPFSDEMKNYQKTLYLGKRGYD